MHAATCRTPNCENENISFILNNPGAQIMCGPCGQWITDIDPPLPEPEPEPAQDI